MYEAAPAAAAGGKGFAYLMFAGIKNDHGYGAHRRSCSGYFGDDNSDGGFCL